MNKISACIIVKNEGKIIGNCLKNIKDIVDEIIVVDGYSKDNTVEVCKRYTDKVFKHKWSGSFATERNYSISKAKFEWILVLDADEILSEKVKNKIRELICSDKINGYYFPRLKIWKNNKSLRHGKAYPDYQLRLFRKKSGKFIKDVHERVKAEGEVEKLGYGYDIIHYASFELNMFKRQLKYARMHAKKARIAFQIKDILSVLWGFFIKKGFMDGLEGFKYHLFKIFYELSVIYFIFKNNIHKI